MKKIIKRIITYFVILIFFISLGFSANLQVFTKYDTQISIYKNNTFEISKNINLRNIHDVGVVPGEIQFKISNPISDKSFKINKLTVTNRYNDKIKHQLIKTDNGYVIILDIFTPVLPGFEFIININILAEYESNGLLFKNLEIPLKEESDISIKEGKVNLILPQSTHLTYSSYKNNNTIINKNNITWQIDSNTPSSVVVEYSSVPVKIGNTKGSVVFWTTINIILLILLLIHIKKTISKTKKNKSKKDD